jgi:hypothetical protein
MVPLIRLNILYSVSNIYIYIYIYIYISSLYGTKGPRYLNLVNLSKFSFQHYIVTYEDLSQKCNHLRFIS